MDAYKLEAKGITVNFDGAPVIKDVSMNLRENELVSLLGVSGVGKSTLFNIMSGVLKADNGQVLINGQDETGKTGHVSYMQQKDLLQPHLTVIDNVCLPLFIRGTQKKEAREMANQHFSEFGIEGTQKKYPSQLSGGMRQRAALLRTYLFSSDVALLDEPFSALDAITKRSMHSWYLDLMRRINMSTVFITHDIDEAILLSDRIYIMTGPPGVISNEIIVNAKRPRTSEFIVSDEFVKHKREILKILAL